MLHTSGVATEGMDERNQTGRVWFMADRSDFIFKAMSNPVEYGGYEQIDVISG